MSQISDTFSMSRHLKSLLTRIGTTDDEAAILLAIYQHPASPVGRIAQLAGYKRGHAYNLVGSLLSKGLVNEVAERGVMRVTGIPPAQLPTRLERARDETTKLLVDVTAAIGAFEALIPKTRGTPRVQVFRGSQGLMELYETTLSCKEKVIRACADFSNLFPRRRHPELNDWLWRYAERRAKRGIVYKGMLVPSRDSDIAFKKRRAQKRELRVLNECPLTVEVNIFDSYVAICSTAEEMMGVLIDSQAIAGSAKNLFNSMWDRLPPYSTE